MLITSIRRSAKPIRPSAKVIRIRVNRFGRFCLEIRSKLGFDIVRCGCGCGSGGDASDDGDGDDDDGEQANRCRKLFD